MLTQVLVHTLREIGGEVTEESGAIRFARMLAERRAFLSRRKLVYQASVRVDEDNREVHLSESLTETSSGLSSESGSGFRVESYRTRPGSRAGDIAEQARLFGKTYAYTFDHGAIRRTIEALAREHGYAVVYRITGS